MRQCSFIRLGRGFLDVNKMCALLSPHAGEGGALATGEGCDGRTTFYIRNSVSHDVTDQARLNDSRFAPSTGVQTSSRTEIFSAKLRTVTLEQRTLRQLEELACLKPCLELRRVLIAVSGGADSVALLHLLRGHAQIAVAHLDHGLRSSSSGDAAFVNDLARSLELPYATERVDVQRVATQRGWSVEDAARRVRYGFLTRSAKELGCQAILTAHTLNDNSETVLLQLLRGTARATGIPARRSSVLRPLLGTTKAELVAYLLERNLTWREDDSNTDQRFTRNWLRHSVLPLLETRFPGAVLALHRHAQIANTEDALLEDWASRVPDGFDWRLEHQAIQRRLIRRSLEAAGVRVDFAHLEALRSALNNTRSTRISLPGGATGLVRSGQLEVFNPAQPMKALEPPPELLERFPDAQLRTRAAGDTIELPGGTKKLSTALIDRKVPREHRDHLRVLAIGNQVLWVGLEPPLVSLRVGSPLDPEISAMLEALQLAQSAFDAGEVPVGAVVLRGTELVGRGRNRCKASGDMTQHAELEALRSAAAQLGTPYLTGCTLVVTLEPCLMCLGAAIEARVGRIVYGASNPKNGALGGVIDATRGAWNHQFSVRRNLLEPRASALLTRFFAALR